MQVHEEQVAQPVAPPRLTRLEAAELAAIACLVPALYLIVGDATWTLRFGSAVAYASALFLGQGLVRDLVRLALEGRKAPTRTLRCLCAETTVGLVALGAGLGLLLLGIEDTVELGATNASLTVAGVLLAGFFAKDYVLVVRKERDHGSIRIG